MAFSPQQQCKRRAAEGDPPVEAARRIARKAGIELYPLDPSGI
jgi:hypothetical protein